MRLLLRKSGPGSVQAALCCFLLMEKWRLPLLSAAMQETPRKMRERLVHQQELLQTSLLEVTPFALAEWCLLPEMLVHWAAAAQSSLWTILRHITSHTSLFSSREVYTYHPIVL